MIDVQYWKSGSKIKTLYPSEFESKPKILTHYNPYNLTDENWGEYKKVCVVNNYQKSIIRDAKLMPLCIDTQYFNFNRLNYTIKPIINMSVNRIEAKKGVLEVAQACRELKYQFILVGRISDSKYMDNIKKACGSSLDFRCDVPLHMVRKSYHDSAIHVCNSVDNFESGTMPILEAMSSGCAVFTRNIGHVPDIAEESKIHVSDHEVHDIEKIKNGLAKLYEGRQTRIRMRVAARDFVKKRDSRIRSTQYCLLYKEILQSSAKS